MAGPGRSPTPGSVRRSSAGSRSTASSSRPAPAPTASPAGARAVEPAKGRLTNPGAGRRIPATCPRGSRTDAARTPAPQPVLGMDDPLRLDHHERPGRRFVERARPFDMVGLPAEGRPVVLEVPVVFGQYASLTEELGTSAAGLPDQRSEDPHRRPRIRGQISHLRRTSGRGEHHREVEVEVPHRRRERPLRSRRREHAHVLRRQQIGYSFFQLLGVELLLWGWAGHGLVTGVIKCPTPCPGALRPGWPRLSAVPSELVGVFPAVDRQLLPEVTDRRCRLESVRPWLDVGRAVQWRGSSCAVACAAELDYPGVPPLRGRGGVVAILLSCLVRQGCGGHARAARPACGPAGVRPGRDAGRAGWAGRGPLVTWSSRRGRG